MEPYELLLSVVLTACSGFLAGSEIALFTLSKAQLKGIREKFRSIHKVIRLLLGDPAGLLMTILICNEAVNIALSTLITSSMAANHESTGWIAEIREWLLGFAPEWVAEAFIGTLITAPIILIAGEITPKLVSARLNTIAAPIVARPMNFIYQMLAPLRWLIRTLMHLFSLLIPRRAFSARSYGANKLKQEDFLHLVEEAHKDGDIQQTEVDLIRGVFDMDETPVSELVTQMRDVFLLPSNMSVEKALLTIREDAHRQKFSRVPVYEGDRSNIVGILYSKDLLIAKLERIDPQTQISTLLWKPLNVHQNTRISSVFRKMKRQRSHMGIVIDDQGEAIGVVTMNDLLDAMLEELLEDTDTDYGVAR